jgi:hypothetical protein
VPDLGPGCAIAIGVVDGVFWRLAAIRGIQVRPVTARNAAPDRVDDPQKNTPAKKHLPDLADKVAERAIGVLFPELAELGHKPGGPFAPADGHRGPFLFGTDQQDAWAKCLRPVARRKFGFRGETPGVNRCCHTKRGDIGCAAVQRREGVRADHLAAVARYGQRRRLDAGWKA